MKSYPRVSKSHVISDPALLARANFDSNSYDAEKERERAEERERIFERYTQVTSRPKTYTFKQLTSSIETCALRSGYY